MNSPTEATVAVVVTTAPDIDVAKELAARIVEERLAACGNIVPGVTSIYRWQGEVQHDTEALVVFKTVLDAVAILRDRICALHPYDVPEVLIFPVPDGSSDYLSWVRDEVRVP